MDHNNSCRQRHQVGDSWLSQLNYKLTQLNQNKCVGGDVWLTCILYSVISTCLAIAVVQTAQLSYGLYTVQSADPGLNRAHLHSLLMCAQHAHLQWVRGPSHPPSTCTPQSLPVSAY